MGSDIELRELSFASLSEVVPEARRLMEQGYRKQGKWDLAQVCGHLEDWMRFPVEGFPKPGFPVNFMLWLMKKTLGKRMIRKILEQQAMGNNAPTMPQTVKAAGEISDEKAVETLEQAVNQFMNHSGEYHESPLFGKLSREDATRLQLIHCAHHLAYLVPNAN